MKQIGLVCFDESVDTQIISSFLLFKILENQNLRASFIIISESPLQSSVIQQLTGANTVTLPPQFTLEKFNDAVSLAVRGSEALVVVFPLFDLSSWIPHAISLKIPLVGIFGNKLNSELEILCADQIMNSGVFKLFLSFSGRVNTSSQLINIEGYRPLTPRYANLEYHTPRYEYKYLQHLLDQVKSVDPQAFLGESVTTSPHVALKSINPLATRVTLYMTEDSCFNFSFRENVQLLDQYGFVVKTFSPLIESEVPRDADALWFTGSSVFEAIPIIAKNQKFISSIINFLNSGRPIYCEGLSSILFAKNVLIADKKLASTGITDLEFGFTLSTGAFTSLIPVGRSVENFGDRVHGFHISQLVFPEEIPHWYSRFSEATEKVCADFFFPRENLLLTQTFVPLYLNLNFSKLLVNWILKQVVRIKNN
ncbi:MAG: hypothetical protein NZO16_01050 [Deltaproteobacteria bacterium]|nr:hypothetical protein [Deltaproteobacteria bacterium]